MKASSKLVSKKPVEKPAVAEEKKMPPILVAFQKVYDKFLTEQRARLEERKKQFEDDPANAEYLEANFKAYFLEPESIGHIYSHWLSHGVLPNAELGWKNVQGRLAQSKANSEKRQAEWKAYVPWLNEYFKRNPSHRPSDGRRACASHFNVDPKTVGRRTKGYSKPVKN